MEVDGISGMLARIAEIEATLRSIGNEGFIPGCPEAGGGSFVHELARRYSLFGDREVVQEAMRYLGVPYVYGGNGPNGFDCSGFVQYVFRRFGVELPHYTVTQALKGLPVPLNDLRPGDVIFFGENGGRGFLYHVGIYIGNGSFIHAPHTGDVVKVSKLEGKYATNLACARRYL